MRPGVATRLRPDRSQHSSWLNVATLPVEPSRVAITTLISPGQAIFAALGGKGRGHLWSQRSVRVYCSARFGKPDADGAWLLSTGLDGFLIVVRPSRISNRTGLFACRWTHAVEQEFGRQKIMQNHAVGGALQAFRDSLELVAPKTARSFLHACLRWVREKAARDVLDLSYAEFCRQGLRENALASVDVPMVHRVEAALAAFAHEMMRPVMRHGQAITMTGAVPAANRRSLRIPEHDRASRSVADLAKPGLC